MIKKITFIAPSFPQAQQSVSAIAAIASNAAALLSDEAKGALAEAAAAAVQALSTGGTGSVGASFVSQVCTLLGVAMPSAASAHRHRRGRALAQSDVVQQQQAQSRLQQLVGVTAALGGALGRQAVPGADPLAAGDSGVYVAATALLATSNSASAALQAGPGVTSGGTFALAETAEAQLVAAGSLSPSLSGYGIALSYAPSSTAALLLALAGALPADVTLVSGLASVAWVPPPASGTASAGSSGATVGEPSLDGAISYLLLSVPVAEYDTSRGAACLRYEATTTTVSGLLSGLSADDAPAVLLSYNATTRRVTCRVSALGTYVVAQGTPLDAAPPPPPSAAAAPDAEEVLVLTLAFQMNPAQLGVREELEAFRSGLVALLAAALQVAPSAVSIVSLDTTSREGAVLVVVAVRLPAGSRGGVERSASLEADPLAALPADFRARFGVTQLSVARGQLTADGPVARGTDTDTVTGTSESGKAVPIGAVVGGAVGGAVAAALLAALVVVVVRRRRLRQVAVDGTGGSAPRAGAMAGGVASMRLEAAHAGAQERPTEGATPVTPFAPGAVQTKPALGSEGSPRAAAAVASPHRSAANTPRAPATL